MKTNQITKMSNESLKDSLHSNKRLQLLIFLCSDNERFWYFLKLRYIGIA